MSARLARILLIATIAGVQSAIAQSLTGTVVEYVNTADFPLSLGGHYFYTAEPAEQAFVDSGGAGQFTRTGLQFQAGGDTELCRFYGSVSPGPNSHFFTADAAECDQLRSLQRTPRPTDVPQWNDEGVGFEVMNTVDGACPSRTLPVHRAYNNGFTRGFDSNHRYATAREALEPLIRDSGWVYEGIVFCAMRSPNQSTAPSVERQVQASATDISITAVPSTGEAPHVAINPSPSVDHRGRLLVFLPGTQGRPAQYTHILRAAASRGLHAVGVNYPNQTAMGTLCRLSTNPDCYWSARNEVIFGGGNPVSGQRAVTAADSIVNRLNRLLVWLTINAPAEGWGQFLLTDDTVDWSKVVLAGHSQGGGHVGVLAKSVSLSAAVYFSSPDDWNDLNDTPANWTLSRPDVTPPSQQYGFGSDADTLVPNAHAFAHWDNMGLTRPFSGPVLVDGSSAPFSGSHQLRTSLPYNPSSAALTPTLRNHGITVVDTSTPVDGSGKPLFDTNGVWAYLCFQ